MRRRTNNALFVPNWRGGDLYLQRLSAGLERERVRVSFGDFPGGYFQLTRLANAHSSVGVIHIHWLADDFVKRFFWSRNELKFGVRLFLMAVDTMLCRLRGIRVVWTVHNLIEHESISPDPEIRVRSLLARSANVVIAHSEGALDLVQASYGVDLTRKGRVIPHGNYLGVYPYKRSSKDSLKANLALEDGDFTILYFGRIRRYKGLQSLLPVFRSVQNGRLRLIIAGSPHNGEIRRWIVDEAQKDERVRLSLEFIPPQEVAAYFALADVVVLPFQSILTSGSAILAMGFGKCLILPSGARVLGIPGDRGAIYYKDESGLAELIATLPQRDLTAMGDYNREIARMLDWQKIAAATAKAYRAI